MSLNDVWLNWKPRIRIGLIFFSGIHSVILIRFQFREVVKMFAIMLPYRIIQQRVRLLEMTRSHTGRMSVWI